MLNFIYYISLHHRDPEAAVILPFFGLVSNNRSTVGIF